MKNKILIIGLFFISSCNQQRVDLYTLLVDRVWISDLNNSQFYLSSTDDIKYIWISLNQNGGISTDLTITKGTPYTNPLLNHSDNYKEGWAELSYFKIKDDTIIYQDIEDVKGEYLSEYKIKITEDTLIGILKYDKIIVTNEFSKRIWVSKKR